MKGERHTLALFVTFTFTVVFDVAVILTIILWLALAVDGASRAVPSVIVAISAVVLAAWRIGVTAATRWRGTTAASATVTAWRAFATRWTTAIASTTLASTTFPSAGLAITSGLEAPRCRRRSTGPLDLQDVISAETLVMHLMIGIVSVTATLVLDKSEEATRGGARSRNVAADETAEALEFVGKVAGSRTVAEARHVESGSAARHVGCAGIREKESGD